jgi:hypothetical protein
VEIARQIREGDRNEGMRSLLDAHGRLVCACLWREFGRDDEFTVAVLGDPGLAERVARWEPGRGASLRSWFLIAARSIARNYREAERKHRHAELPGHLEDRRSPETSPDQHRRDERLRLAIGRIPNEQQRRAMEIELREGGHADGNCLAEELNVNLNHAHQIRHRAYKAVRKIYQDNGWPVGGEEPS